MTSKYVNPSIKIELIPPMSKEMQEMQDLLNRVEPYRPEIMQALTTEEAQQAEKMYDDAPAIPLSKKRIQEIVKYILDR